MQHWSDKLALVLLTFWVGGMWAVGYLVAPSLFYTLHEQRALAGELAGHLFTLMAYAGMICAFYLLIQRLARQGTQSLKQGYFWMIFLMLLLTLAGHFGIQPIIAQLKAQAMPVDVMNSVFADRFKTWHGVASIAYLVQSLLGIGVILKFRT